MVRKELHISGFVHVSVMAMISGLISTAIAFSSSIFEFMLRAFVVRIFRLVCVFVSLWVFSALSLLWAFLSAS